MNRGPVHNGAVRLLTRTVILVALLAGSTACARLHARTQPTAPPLEAPPPPPRAVIPLESEPVAVSLPPISDPAVRRPARDAPRTTPPARPAQTESAAASTPPPSQPSEPVASPRTLQTTADASGAEQKVRALLANAARDLGRIDSRTLSADAKAQYDIARRFSEQAEEALKAKNLVFAGQLADKASTLAALLLKR